MKLIKCYVSSFGTLSDFEYNFNEGLNVINKPNGWGKSTFATFIKCMFYGLNDKKKSIEENERKKYSPWNSSDKFGGYVIFERKGTQFKIERYFGKRPIDDTVSLIDLKTGRVYKEQEDLGKRLFGVDEEGFLFSTYLSQNNFSVKSNTSLTAKYNKTYEIQDSDLFDAALIKLQNKVKTLAMRGEKGEIYDLNRQIAIIKEKLLYSQSLKNQLVSLNEKLKELDREIEEIKVQSNVANENLSKIEGVVKYNLTLDKREKLFSELKILEEKKQNLLSFFKQNLSPAEKIDEYITVLEDYNKTLNTVNVLSSSLVELKEKSLSANKPTDKPKKTPLVASIIAFLLSFLGFLASATVGIVLACITFAVLLAVIFFTLKKKNVIVENPLFEIIDSNEKELFEFKEILSKYKTVIDSYLDSFNVDKNDYKTALSTIKQNYNDYLSVLTEISNVQEELKNTVLSPEVSKEHLSINADEEKVKARRLNEILSVKERERGDFISEINRLEEKIDSIIDLETQLSYLEEKLQADKEEYKALNHAIDFLIKADENLKIKYREPLENSLNKYLSYLGGEFTATIDVDFNVSVLEKSGQKATGYYSEGLKNMFDICKRFAIIDVLFKDEKPFIILDDPFSNLDKEKITSSLKVLNKIQKDYQILYLVCHDSRANITGEALE